MGRGFHQQEGCRFAIFKPLYLTIRLFYSPTAVDLFLHQLHGLLVDNAAGLHCLLHKTMLLLKSHLNRIESGRFPCSARNSCSFVHRAVFLWVGFPSFFNRSFPLLSSGFFFQSFVLCLQFLPHASLLCFEFATHDPDIYSC